VTAYSRWWLVAQASVTIGLLTLLIRSLDLNAFHSLFLRLPAWFYLVSLGVVLAGQIAYAWRWQLLLAAAGVTVPFGSVIRQYFVGIFVNNFLPSTAGGDVAKVYYLGRNHGYRMVTASVAIDRLLGVGLLAMLASGALWASPVRSPLLTAAGVASVGAAALAITLLIVISVGTGGLPARVTWLGERAVKFAGRLQRLRLDMAAPLRRPWIIVQAAVVVIGYAVLVTVIYMRFVAIQGAAVPSFLAMFAAVTATTVLSNVPISLNGLGLREQLHVSLFAPLGVSREVAVAISLLLYAHLLIASMIGLAFWLQAPIVPSDVTEVP
jgi:uncharacterized protein (TIRG00374 family)